MYIIIVTIILPLVSSDARVLVQVFEILFSIFPGDFVIVDPIEEGNKVCAEIVHILYGKQIKYLKNEGLWPLAFADKASTDEKADDKQINSNVCEKNINGVSEDEEDRDEDYDDEDDDDLFVNPNHQKTTYYVESHSSDNSDNEEWHPWPVL